MPELTAHATEWIAILLTISAGIVAWVAADTRSKARVAFIDEKVANMSTQTAGMLDRVNTLEGKTQRAEHDRTDLQRMIERAETRLDSTKASREVVEGIKEDIGLLRAQLDTRFDKVETLIQHTLTR